MIQFKYLEKGQLMSFDEAVRIRILSGEVWATKEDDQTDYVLTEKGLLCSDNNKLVIIEALQRTMLLYSKQATDLTFVEHTEAADRSMLIDGVASAL